jgi:hypothetical protein
MVIFLILTSSEGALVPLRKKWDLSLLLNILPFKNKVINISFSLGRKDWRIERPLPKWESYAGSHSLARKLVVSRKVSIRAHTGLRPHVKIVVNLPTGSQ